MGLVLLAARCVIAGVFFRAGLAKATDLTDFRSAVANYRLLPSALVPLVAGSLPFLEIGGAAALALGILAGPVAAALAVLLLTFCAAIAINLARGRSFDCGCAGSAPRIIGWQHVLVNLALAIAAGAIAVAPPTTLVIWPGIRGMVTVTTPVGESLPVVLSVLLVLVLAAAARRALAVRELAAAVTEPAAGPGSSVTEPRRH